MPARRQSLLLEAAASLLVARLLTALIPARRLDRTGAFVSPSDPRVAVRSRACCADDARKAEIVGWAVRQMARHMPFRAVCLQQAMAARAMLRRRGVASVVHFGAATKGGEALETHAWLDAAGVRVTGYPIDPKLIELGCLL